MVITKKRGKQGYYVPLDVRTHYHRWSRLAKKKKKIIPELELESESTFQSSESTWEKDKKEMEEEPTDEKRLTDICETCEPNVVCRPCMFGSWFESNCKQRKKIGEIWILTEYFDIEKVFLCVIILWLWFFFFKSPYLLGMHTEIFMYKTTWYLWFSWQ